MKLIKEKVYQFQFIKAGIWEYVMAESLDDAIEIAKQLHPNEDPYKIEQISGSAYRAATKTITVEV